MSPSRPVRPARLGLAAVLAAAALCMVAPSSAYAGVVSCPSGETYSIAQGDPPLSFQGSCAGDGALAYTLVSGPSHGSLVGSSNGAATYTPSVGFSGTDQFTYRATDAEGGFDEETVTINVSGPPANGLPPSCPDPVRTFVPQGDSVPLTGNCSDPDGDSSAIQYGIVSNPTQGSLQIVSGNQVVYTPSAGATQDSFRYSARDSAGNTVQARVEITVTPPGTTEVSTGEEATAAQPLIAGVATSSPGNVTIGPRPTSVAPPEGYFLLGTEFNILAPAQTLADRLRLTFTVDRSQVPLAGDIVVFRDGEAIEDDCTAPLAEAPDPCIEGSGPVDAGDPQSDVRITILSSHASRWNLGVRDTPDTDGDGRIDTADNCPEVSNPGQANTDGDAEGDACDADDDNDGVADGSDACQTEAGAAQNGCPLPTTKEQCKGTGWKGYGTTFRNQGDCVSYVATRGRNGPKG